MDTAIVGRRVWPSTRKARTPPASKPWFARLFAIKPSSTFAPLRNLHLAPQRKHLRLPRSASNLHRTGQCVFSESMLSRCTRVRESYSDKLSSKSITSAGQLELNLRWLQPFLALAVTKCPSCPIWVASGHTRVSVGECPPTPASSCSSAPVSWFKIRQRCWCDSGFKCQRLTFIVGPHRNHLDSGPHVVRATPPPLVKMVFLE